MADWNKIQDLEVTRFQCRRCASCCLQEGYVYLKSHEPDAMADVLGISPHEFVNHFCELIDRRRLVLKKHPNEVCIFLGDKGCLIHAAKPQQCRDFPVMWRTPNSFNYCEGLKALDEAASER